jgi:acetyltransferase-like isoleucine patch superfamily enzyme
MGEQKISVADLEEQLRQLLRLLQQKKIAEWQRRVPLGDLISDRAENARQYGFGEGTSCYDNVLIIGNVSVGRNCWIGPNVILDGRGGLILGDYVTVSAGVQIYTHDTVERTITYGREPISLGPTTIGSAVYIGPNTIIQKGITIGDRSVIGSMSLVNRNIPADAKAWGVPARVVSSMPPSQG